jgi:guanine deaminase
MTPRATEELRAGSTTYRGHLLTPAAEGTGWDDWPDARLLVREGRVVEAGPWRRGASADVDLRPDFLFPGLVDVHAHVPQLAVCGVHPESLLDWLRRWTFPLEQQFKGERARRLTRGFLAEMLAQGTTTAALYTSAWPDSVEACFEEAASLGLHAWIGPPLMDTDAYRPVTTRRVLEEAADLATLDSPTRRFVVTPRFALSATPALLAGCAALARDRGLPIQTHLAEQRQECEAVRRRFGQDYLDVYEEAGLLTPDSLFAHAVWLSPSEWRRLARRGCAVAHCPTSNVFLGSGVMNWDRAQQLRVGLGSDVGAGPDLSVFRVARMTWTLRSLNGRTPPGASALLRAATRGGAEALGFTDVGALRPGNAADFIVLDAALVIPPGAPRTESTDDLLSRILHRAGRSAVRRVYVSGVLRHQ